MLCAIAIFLLMMFVLSSAVVLRVTKKCCMVQVLGRCFDIATAWEEGMYGDLVRVMRWRVQRGEKTAAELARIGIRLKAVII